MWYILLDIIPLLNSEIPVAPKHIKCNNNIAIDYYQKG